MMATKPWSVFYYVVCADSLLRQHGALELLHGGGMLSAYVVCVV